MAAIIRLKRKATEEPADGLVIALKKPKYESSDAKEVLFKFAATVNSENESIRDHIQAALLKEKTAKSKRRELKDAVINEDKVTKVRERLMAEHKTANEKKKLDHLNNRRLILTEEFENLEDSFSQDAEVRRLFHLYDIIEENEEVKKQNDEIPSTTITCNDQPLIREKLDYVFDVYIADGHIDQTFTEETVSVRPCTLTEDDIYFGGSDSEELYEDEDDSNDENNWRNEYPEDEDSNSEPDSLASDAEIYDIDDIPNEYHEELTEGFNDFYISDDDDVDEAVDEYSVQFMRPMMDAYSINIMRPMRDQYSINVMRPPTNRYIEEDDDDQ